VDLGVEDPELFALLGLLEDDIGADRISDMATHAIKPALAAFTVEQVQDLDIATEQFRIGDGEFHLPRNPFVEGKPIAVLLVPEDILRELPIATDWEGAADAAHENEDLRNRVNKEIGEIWKARTRQDKQYARDRALSDRKAFEALMDAVGARDRVPYDPEEDHNGHYIWRNILRNIADDYPKNITSPGDYTADELEKVVDQVIEHFTDLIENNGLWKVLWYENQPRHEKAAQLLFFAIAEAYCQANNLDISPESDSGGGPVDFKFSAGYDARVLVEIKRSRGKVESGYRKQIEVYKNAESTFRAKYLVVDVGKMGEKLDNILAIKNYHSGEGDPVTDIYVADATPQEPASKQS
jgi:hypothetical protein